jgi:hypothetical protein
LVTEFAPRGSLSDAFNDMHDEGTIGDVSVEHQMVMMRQICQGMEMLAIQKVIHRDLAARNVLLFHFDPRDAVATSVKVSDFGLSVGSYGRSHAYAQGTELPHRYLAPEAIKRGRFSEKTDVWAFGVTMWEVLTHGNIPYFEIPRDEDVIAHVLSGGRLQRPEGCPGPLWGIVERCWAVSPAARPTFAQLSALLGGLQPGVAVGGNPPKHASSITEKELAKRLEKISAQEKKLAAQEQQMAAKAKETAEEGATLHRKEQEAEQRQQQLLAKEAGIKRMENEAGARREQLVAEESERQRREKEAAARRKKTAEEGAQGEEEAVKVLREARQKQDIDVILAVMAQHRDSTKVQEQGCFALGSVAYIAATWPTIAEKGGIEAVFHAMTQHSHHEWVQKWGCRVMYMMVDLESAIPAIRKGKAVMDAARNNFPNNSNIQLYLNKVYAKI